MDLAVPVSRVDHVRGAAAAPITIVEYGDFQCPACAAVEPGFQQLLQVHARTVRLVYRHFPLEGIHPEALCAAEAAEAAGAQGRFWEMHDLLFHRQQHLGRAHLDRYADELGLDTVRFRAEMDDEIHRQRVREHLAGGEASRVRGTPGVFVNGAVFDASAGLRPLFALVEQLEQHGRRHARLTPPVRE